MSVNNFNQLLIGHSDHLQWRAIVFTRDKEEAKDLLHDTFYKALANQEKFKPGTNLQAWLFTIMRNIFINGYRRKIKGEQVFSKRIGLEKGDNQIISGGLTESWLESKDVIRAIHSMPDIFRIPFCLYFEGYKYKEIAGMMNLATGTVKSRIYVARQALRQQFGGLYCG
jgi:RNA polymerase sigma factor (sigma-70 family)